MRRVEVGTVNEVYPANRGRPPTAARCDFWWLLRVNQIEEVVISTVLICSFTTVSYFLAHAGKPVKEPSQ